MTIEPVPTTVSAAPPQIEQLMLDDLYQPPPEDGGAPTRDNYHYQDQVLAAECFRMRNDPRIVKFICEWHEDFVVVRNGEPSLELVSVKHGDHGDYPSLRTLCEEGGLAHLFNLWISYRRKPVTRLVSNKKPGGRPSENTPRALEDVLQQRALDSARGQALLLRLAWTLTEICAKAASAPNRQKKTLAEIPSLTGPLPKERDTAKGLPENLLLLLRRFLDDFTFDCGRPHRDHIQAVTLAEDVIPAGDTYGYTIDAASAVYKAVLDLLDAPSRDKGGRPGDVARYLSGRGGYDPHDTVVQTVNRRTVHRDAIVTAITGAARSHVSALPPLLLRRDLPPRAPGAHLLIGKMTAGRLDPSDQERILQLRDLWVDTWPRVSTGLPGDAETLFRLELDVLDVVDRARVDVATTPGPYALMFKARLHEQLRTASLASATDARLDTYHVLGYAYELSALCKFGFTRPEDR